MSAADFQQIPLIVRAAVYPETSFYSFLHRYEDSRFHAGLYSHSIPSDSLFIREGPTNLREPPLHLFLVAFADIFVSIHHPVMG